MSLLKQPDRTLASALQLTRTALRPHALSPHSEDRTFFIHRSIGEEGQLVAYFGERRVDEIARGDLLTWWETEIEGRGRAINTGLNYLNSLAAVFGLAEDLDHIEQSPVASFRRTLKRRRLTKRGRLEAQERDQRHPIESAEALRAFLAASEAASQLRKGNGKPQLQRHAGYVADLLMLDAGLRVGEVAGLRWSHVHLGESPSDPTRRLVIEQSRARERYRGAPKSGRTREVPLSRRLRRVLRAWWVAQGQPRSEEHVLPGFHPTNYQRRHFALVLTSAKLEGRGYTPENLRHSFASWLLTAGGPVAYVGELLGHADGGITASKHYAKCVPRGYAAPAALSDGELVVDLLERIAKSPQSDPTSVLTVESDVLGRA